MTKVWLLLLIQIAIIPVVVLLLRKFKFLNFASSLVLTIYCVTFPISGIAHFLTTSSLFRGYFDLVSFAHTNLPFETALLSLITEICLVIGILLSGRFSNTNRDLKISNHRVSRKQTFVLLGIIPLSIYASMIIRQFLDTYNIKRVLFLDGGLARYYFIAIWIAWPIVIFSTYLLYSRRFVGKSVRQFVLISVTGIMLFTALRWTGSRLLPLLFLTVVILNAPKLSRKIRGTIVLLSPIFFGVYIYATTLNRIGSFEYGKNTFNIGGFFDWQVGRFSILGATLKINSDFGVLQGSTIVGSITQSISGVARLIGITVFNDVGSYLSVSQEFGVVVFSDPNNRYLAPGLIVEMYRNFGLMGLILFSLLTPMITNWLYAKSFREYNILSNLLFGYFTIAFVFIVFLSSSESLIAYFFYYPMPLILIILINNVQSKKRSRHE